jgi:hypothetical protein
MAEIRAPLAEGRASEAVSARILVVPSGREALRSVRDAFRTVNEGHAEPRRALAKARKAQKRRTRAVRPGAWQESPQREARVIRLPVRAKAV